MFFPHKNPFYSSQKSVFSRRREKHHKNCSHFYVKMRKQKKALGKTGFLHTRDSLHLCYQHFARLVWGARIELAGFSRVQCSCRKCNFCSYESDKRFGIWEEEGVTNMEKATTGRGRGRRNEQMPSPPRVLRDCALRNHNIQTGKWLHKVLKVKLSTKGTEAAKEKAEGRVWEGSVVSLSKGEGRLFTSCTWLGRSGAMSEPWRVQGSRAGDQQAGNSSVEKDGSLQGNGLYLLHYLKVGRGR